MNNRPSVRLIRHATLLIEMGNKKVLIDPMLSAKEALDPVQNCGNDIRIPMVDLPFGNGELMMLLKEVDAIIVTHLHRDHWDLAAQSLIDKNRLIICQPSDVEKIKGQGFRNVDPVPDQINWEDIIIYRTGGKHGTGEIGLKMGEVSGFVLQYDQHKIYVAGDTIWCEDVEKALNKYKPEVTIVNAGGAQFLTGDPITMTPDDVINVHKKYPETKIIAVHMDTVNHCFVKRNDLKRTLDERHLASEIIIPLDGEIVNL